MKHMAALLLASGSVLLAGCVEDDALYTGNAYHEHHPHYHTSTTYVTSHYDSQPVYVPQPAPQSGNVPIVKHHPLPPQPVTQPVVPATSTGYQVNPDEGSYVSGEYNGN